MGAENYRVRIKIGAHVSQDFGQFNWPGCKPPRSEYNKDETYEYKTKYPDAIFHGRWNGRYWDCVKEGYGEHGVKGGYGNGSIFVFDRNGVEFADEEFKKMFTMD